MPLELGFKKLEDPGVEMLKFAGKRYRFLLFALIGIILLAPMAGTARRPSRVRSFGHGDLHDRPLGGLSFLKLTTVGYGDIVPARDLARGFAVVEAIVGQFYIAVLVAELIGRRGGKSNMFEP